MISSLNTVARIYMAKLWYALNIHICFIESFYSKKNLLPFLLI